MSGPRGTFFAPEDQGCDLMDGQTVVDMMFCLDCGKWVHLPVAMSNSTWVGKSWVCKSFVIQELGYLFVRTGRRWKLWRERPLVKGAGDIWRWHVTQNGSRCWVGSKRLPPLTKSSIKRFSGGLRRSSNRAASQWWRDLLSCVLGSTCRWSQGDSLTLWLWFFLCRFLVGSTNCGKIKVVK